MLMRTFVVATALAIAAATASSLAQNNDFVPVTREMLLKPSPDDWLMFSRTYDAQRFSPLTQINKQNVGQLRMVWTRGLAPGQQETTPIVYRGVMYVATPSASLQALDATTGDLIWEHKRPGINAGGGNTKGIAIFDDMVYYTAPGSAVVALDARTGQVRWEAKVDQRAPSGGTIVVDGKVISSGSCGKRSSCYISAHDAKTGKELWKFYTAAGPGDPGDATWGKLELEKRAASTWGLPGSYDPVRKLIFWGVANPVPFTRLERQGNVNAVSKVAPAELYSNSTLALNPDTGKLAWYYQYLPGDDWDLDGNEERVLLRTPVNPDPKFVRWINPRIRKGEVRDVSVNITEGGGLWALDRATGQFLWATPFPYDTPNFYLQDIDIETGRTVINEKMLVSEFPGARKTVCYWNTKSYWASAYDARKNFLYAPYIDNCLDMSSPAPAANGQPAKPQMRAGQLRPTGDPKVSSGLARINMATGEIQRWQTGQVPTNGSVLLTAGDLIFWGDLNRRFRAFDIDSGKILWESVLGGTITASTITYSANGKQYVAVMTGTTAVDEPLVSGHMAPVKQKLGTMYRHNAIYVFALP
jgi:PQQ-dependent dehydrogenase (methanol/ethanol family)